MSEIDRLIESMVDAAPTLGRHDLTRVGNDALPNVAPLADTAAVQHAVDAIAGLGPLEQLMAHNDVTDILVNGPDEVWIERDGALERTDVTFRSDEDVVAMVRRVVSRLGLRLDRASPAVDARLPDGSRLHALIPPATVDGPVVAIRRFINAVADLDALAESGSVTLEGRATLTRLVTERRNVLIAGATGSGKTTVLNVLASAIPTGDRIVTIEDAAELSIPGHVVRLEAHPPNVEGAGEITIRSLVRHALRLRPDRLIVGEVRGPEALDMIQALNTGHSGSMSTIHANGADEALSRLTTLATMAPEHVPEETLVEQVRSAIDVVVVMARTEAGRLVRSIHERCDGDLVEVYRC
ncbi:MAG: Flp pilus assembly complex ATPase component TadA [Actinomycetia bacterium]|nr:Flp pilus assembly complex ATPase component TadA [Actinomycetes bacterium]